jgi:hypothetical protein
VTLRPGQSVVPLSVEFLSHPRSQQQPQHPPTPGGGQGGGAEQVTPSLSRQGSINLRHGILSPLTRQPSLSSAAVAAALTARSRSPMLPPEMIEPVPKPPTQSTAATGGVAADGGPLGSSSSSSLKRVIELWHGRHQQNTNANPSAGGGERESTPDSIDAGGEGIAALLREMSEEKRSKELLLAIINPSAESLCEALAYGEEWTAGRRRRRRRKGSKGSEGDEGEAELSKAGVGEEADGAGGAQGDGGDSDGDDGMGPLHLDTLAPAALDDLPHNRWLALPLLKATDGSSSGSGGGGGGGNAGGTAGRPRTSTYEIDMPMIPGPAVVFFYSPYGRLRLRGVLRDDGAEPILEMD